MSPQIYEINGKRPKIDPDVAFIAESAIIQGDVEIGKGSVIFDNVVIEGYPAKVKIGDYTNIQSGTIIHVMGDSGVTIGNYCTIGHRSIIHGCTLEDLVTIGIGAIVMGYSQIQQGSIVGAGALVTERKVFPPNTMILGVPAQITKKLDLNMIEKAKEIAMKYSSESRLIVGKRLRI